MLQNGHFGMLQIRHLGMLRNGHLGMLQIGQLGMSQIGCLEHATEWALFVGNATDSELSAASYKIGIACGICYKWVLPVGLQNGHYLLVLQVGIGCDICYNWALSAGVTKWALL